MAKVEYPKVVYRPGESRTVKNAEEHLALGKGWSESPVAEPASEVKPEVEKPKRKGLLG
jgi:hypothetical protein